MKHAPHHILLAGAAPDTGNHGVTALGLSAAVGLRERGASPITFLDNGKGLREDRDLDHPHRVFRLGFRPGRNFFSPDTMLNARLCQRLGLPHRVVNAMRRARAIIDVSGGDSFSDIYGEARFRQIACPKLMAIKFKRPLVLLPQTYGPYLSSRTLKVARYILQRSHLAFARDARSFAYMQDILGDDFDPNRHKLGVDLAFGLATRTPKSMPLQRAVGINVSGLLWHQPEKAKNRFSLAGDYRETMRQSVTAFIERGHQVLLVPHVIAPDSAECDLRASKAFLAGLPPALRIRVRIYEGPYDPCTLKGVIAETRWFAGARMHATIAALSTATPVVNMAYSDKAAGVFECMKVGQEVIDLRCQNTAETVTQMLAAFDRRGAQRSTLQSAKATVTRQWCNQMDLIAQRIAEPLNMFSSKAGPGADGNYARPSLVRSSMERVG